MDVAFQWLVDNYESMCVLLTSIVGLATLIVGMTPTKRDDEILAKVIKILDYFSLVNPKGTETKRDTKNGK